MPCHAEVVVVEAAVIVSLGVHQAINPQVTKTLHPFLCRTQKKVLNLILVPILLCSRVKLLDLPVQRLALRLSLHQAYLLCRWRSSSRC